jgi:uncharacterized protein
MKSRTPSNHVDVAAWAETGHTRVGETPLHELARLARSVRVAPKEPVITWRLTGEWRATADGVRRPALALEADVVLPLACQRCLSEVDVPIHVDRHLIFAPDETQAAALDADADDDVLALVPQIDLQKLVEDELILALPMIPRHVSCPEAPVSQVQSDGFAAAAEDRRRPFDILAHLKKTGRSV